MDELNFITRSRYDCDSCGNPGPTGYEKAKDAPLEEWTAEPSEEPEGNFYSDRYGDW